MKKTFRYFIIFTFLFSLLLDSQTALAAGSEYSEEYYLNTTKASLLTGDTLSLYVEGTSDEEISFSSEDESIVSVESTGENSCQCTGLSVGSTVITVKVRKKVLIFTSSTTTLRCKVTVTPSAVSIRFKKRTYRVSVGKKKKAKVVLRPSITSEKPTFSSSNTRIATVNSKGRVSARAAGTATITATLKNGMQAECKIIVTKKQ